ncbi:alpha/beta-hydrolase [Guyanagaster necrorhizus]|uniref:Alpha/beta-hydrolase n=1 Tax=Guyanagaster necrorhizus TaxID=856835 RepID=A0A9P7VKV0_9AGAR|nr:alpha/beta-hydrolase [Guyanagaster necrorhizus MCA 3950]KAG7441821.1 alpha/beta-hydrolase [Guyanagaster necrorhizus MCA 3950]
MSGQLITSPDGTRIWADATGTPGKPPVVFIHGFLGSGLNWIKQFNDKLLLDKLYMIKYETRGHGRSDQPESEDAYASAKHAEDFQAVCAAFDVTKPVIVSWSLGGVVVPEILSRYGTHPVPVAGHVMLNALPWISMSREIAKPYNATIISSIRSPHTTEFHNALKEFIGAFVAPGNSVSFEDQCAWIGSAAGMNIAARTFSLSREQDETALLSVANELPILCIQGTEDVLVDVEKHEEFMKKHFGNNLDYRRLPGAGHAPFYEFPEVVNPMIIHFAERMYDSAY